jgi:hypothetical protein
MSEAISNQNGRHVNGTFGPGHPFSVGKGRPAKSVDFKQALLGCVTPDRVREVEEALFVEVKKGNVGAIRTWLEHCVGKPLQAVEVSGKDGGAIDVRMIGEAMLAALGDDPDARLKVANVFRRLAESGMLEPGPEVRPGPVDEGHRA